MSDENLNGRPLGRLLAVSFVLAVLAAGVAVWRLSPGRGPAVIDFDNYEMTDVIYEPARFVDLAGWTTSDAGGALDAFRRSCIVMAARAPSELFNNAPGADETLGRVGDWRGACSAGASVTRASYADDTAYSAAARDFFERSFTPLKVISLFSLTQEAVDGNRRDIAPLRRSKGIFTGYFEPSYRASPVSTPRFSSPVLARPVDLVMVDLGRFRENLAGQRIAGKVRNGVLTPYPDRTEIEEGALASVAQPIAFVQPNDLFFLQIQGSGKLEMPGGEVLRVGYDGQNGRPYTAIGRKLIEQGALTLDNVSMQTILDWLNDAKPADAAALRRENESYVFFRSLDDLTDGALGPIGAQGVQLTPDRSIAVDRRFHGLGAPVWVSLDREQQATARLSGLYIAQDTGGAIKGPIRGDLFIGGPLAGEVAGALRAEGELFVLAPKPIAARLEQRIAQNTGG